jgi:hypothetical protein
MPRSFPRFSRALGARSGPACSHQRCCARQRSKSVKRFLRFFGVASALPALALHERRRRHSLRSEASNVIRAVPALNAPNLTRSSAAARGLGAAQ